MTDRVDADTAEELADRVESGDLRLYELGEHADADTAAAARRLVVERHSGAELDTTGDYSFPAEKAAGSNIENMIGAAQIPMGVAGPVTIDGGAYSGETYLPLATTEGALLASVNRGLSVIDDAGGATARVTKQGMTRAPVFQTSGIAESQALAEWVRDDTDLLREAAESTTSHGKLLDVTPYVVGDNVFLRFRYDTADAMGMNMATIATGEACDVIEAETDASLVALSGNLCTDKKPAAINAVEGRGRSVTAEALLPGSSSKRR
ncbi:3-hydroxy-3-methylglutaryl-coenzyme A reductase [Halolamina pelagica]|uniref:hydroxymethylglutaryl-CoA reductase (NADPH) n=1 Tax=Halolamina pelagica TaxID=699431 RepID=A0A0P7GMD0_9EURY|nr:3-hydroxy-3-methylglutaryl-coenzyme A reductase [Halolamina pelagica]